MKYYSVDKSGHISAKDCRGALVLASNPYRFLMVRLQTSNHSESLNQLILYKSVGYIIGCTYTEEMTTDLELRKEMTLIVIVFRA